MSRPTRPQLTPILVSSLAAAWCAAAEPPALLPHPSAYRMASVARAVIEGVLQADGSVRVSARHFVGADLAVADSIRVHGLDRMPLTAPFAAAPGNGQPIRPDAVVLFLESRDEDGVWHALHHHGQAARGVLWICGDDLWGYGQAISPGPYTLGEWFATRGAGAHMTPEDLRGEIATAVAAREALARVLAITEPQPRALALAKWFSPSTSPDGEHWSERLAADLLPASDALGPEMVMPLAGIVQNDPDGGAVGAAATALSRLGESARRATPGMIARLRMPGDARPIELLRALRAVADARAADVLRDYVPHEDPFVAAAAALALHACGGADAGSLLAARVPEQIGGRQELAGLTELLQALHQIDAPEAERLLRERYLEWDQLTRQFPWTRRVRDAAAGR